MGQENYTGHFIKSVGKETKQNKNKEVRKQADRTREGNWNKQTKNKKTEENLNVRPLDLQTSEDIYAPNNDCRFCSSSRTSTSL